MFEAIEKVRRLKTRWLGLTVASLATVMVLSACGGGGSDSSGQVNIGVVVGGVVIDEPPVSPGGSLSVVMHAGESLNLDAGEPVVWTLFVGGTAVNTGEQVFYAGADITATQVSSSAIVVDTFAAHTLADPVPFTAVATSTIDSAQVATVDVLITN
jgi:hypothetical protein